MLSTRDLAKVQHNRLSAKRWAEQQARMPNPQQKVKVQHKSKPISDYNRRIRENSMALSLRTWGLSKDQRREAFPVAPGTSQREQHDNTWQQYQEEYHNWVQSMIDCYCDTHCLSVMPDGRLDDWTWQMIQTLRSATEYGVTFTLDDLAANCTPVILEEEDEEEEEIVPDLTKLRPIHRRRFRQQQNAHRPVLFQVECKEMILTGPLPRNEAEGYAAFTRSNHDHEVRVIRAS